MTPPSLNAHVLCRELNVLEGAHGTDPMGLQGGQVGLENIQKTYFDKLSYLHNVTSR